MKSLYTLLSLVVLSGFLLPAFAQKATYLGKTSELSAIYQERAAAAAGFLPLAQRQVSHLLAGNAPLVLELTASKKEGASQLFYGKVANVPYSSFYLKLTGNTATGSIIMREQKQFFRYWSTGQGNVYLAAENIDTILCVGVPEMKAAPRPTPANGPVAQSAPAATVPNLQSLPGANAVLYLDFDGQTVSNTLWNSNFNNGNPIVAAAASLTEGEMTEVWKLMSEDYRPFQLNVTTSEAVFNSVPANRRMRIIFTPTDYFYPGAGGVAYIGSFTWGGTTYGETPCWVFNAGIIGAGEAGSHEGGHTMGLIHDGRTSPQEEYFTGQNSWAPIMGVGYYVPVVQWSKGEYPNASNTEDDLNIITTQNGFGYRTDDHGNTINTATPLVREPDGTVLAAANQGVISTYTDVDMFSFTTNGGLISLDVNPNPNYPNLDIFVKLRNASGTVIATFSKSGMGAAVDAELAAGTYYLAVDGAKGDLGANSDYGSLGAYSIASKEYCQPVYTDGCVNYATLVNNFSFNTLVNNGSGCGSGTANGYTLYPATGSFTTTVQKGQTYSLSMQAANYNEYFGVWIDYNRDKDFDDAGEFVYASPFASISQFTTNITIPASAAAGTTRMRVRSNWDPALTAGNACTSFTWGEAEDYIITIAGAAVVPTITASGATTNLCPGTSVTLTSSQAASYQWNTGATTQSITVTEGGSYTVTTEGGTSAPTVVSYAACAKPTSLTLSNLTSTSVKLNWAAIQCGVSYTVRYRPINTSTWSKKNVSTNSANITGLSPSTTYQWQVQTVCVKTPKTASAFAKGSNFTTAASLIAGNNTPTGKPVAAAGIDNRLEASVLPNPATTAATLRISGATGNLQVKMTDMTGKILWQSAKVNGAQIALPIEKLAPGMYLVTVSDGQQLKVMKLLKQ